MRVGFAIAALVCIASSDVSLHKHVDRVGLAQYAAPTLRQVISLLIDAGEIQMDSDSLHFTSNKHSKNIGSGQDPYIVSERKLHEDHASINIVYFGQFHNASIIHYEIYLTGKSRLVSFLVVNANGNFCIHGPTEPQLFKMNQIHTQADDHNYTALQAIEVLQRSRLVKGQLVIDSSYLDRREIAGIAGYDSVLIHELKQGLLVDRFFSLSNVSYMQLQIPIRNREFPNFQSYLFVRDADSVYTYRLWDTTF